MTNLLNICSTKKTITTDLPYVNRTKDVINAGLEWFALDMAVGTVADVFHNNSTKLSKKTLLKQTGCNILWAAGSACILASSLEKVRRCIKEKKDIANNDIISNIELAGLSIAAAMLLFTATKKHPKWKGFFDSNSFDMF